MSSLEMEELFAQVSITDQDTAKYFGIAIGGLIAMFTISHWVEKFSTDHLPRSSGLARSAAVVTRPFRRIAKGVALGGFLILPGRIALAVLYLAINALLTFTNVNWSMSTLFAKRLGW